MIKAWIFSFRGSILPSWSFSQYLSYRNWIEQLKFKFSCGVDDSRASPFQFPKINFVVKNSARVLLENMSEPEKTSKFYQNSFIQFPAKKIIIKREKKFNKHGMAWQKYISHRDSHKDQLFSVCALRLCRNWKRHQAWNCI